MREGTILPCFGSGLNSVVTSLPCPKTNAMDCIKNCLRGRRNSFLLLGNLDDVEAVAAMHILEFAMKEVSEQRQEHIDMYNCSMCTETLVLRCVARDMPMIIVLSKDVLKCPLVQRACVLRASRLWPQGNGSANSALAESTLLVQPDRLDFEYPDAAGYEALQGACLDNVRRSSRESATLAMTISDSFKKYDWANLELSFRADHECALALVNFCRWLFNHLALALSTHGSWRTILHEVECMYDRTSNMSVVSNRVTSHCSDSTSFSTLSSSIDVHRMASHFSRRPSRSFKRSKSVA
mmetsp:Transcript_132420/g.257987  ORF Transcript_132420/g.257987 Transcript_132420/m.257987 type:complete len:296 (+) Transcript_132420:2-889(+)